MTGVVLIALTCLGGGGLLVLKLRMMRALTSVECSRTVLRQAEFL
jgi:hypothetical protein